MDYSLNEQQEILKKSARDFFSKELPKALVKEMSTDNRGYPPELWNKMASLGWMGLPLPEKYGGSGGSFLDLVILLEEMGRACLPGPFFSTTVLGALIILDAGSEQQKKNLLPKIAKGELIVTLAMSEPNAINNPDCFETKTRTTQTGYTLNGTKLFVPNAHVADYIITVAKTAKGVSLFLVDAKSPGLTCTPMPTMSGDKQCELKFDSVKIPTENILGTEGKGWNSLEKVLPKATIAKCAELAGGADYVLEITIAYTKQRVQFGRPIGSFQAVQLHVANMVTDVQGCKFMTYQAAWMLNEGIPCTKEVSMAKAWVSEAYRRVTFIGHQIHGGIGFCWDHDMPLYFKQAALGAVTFGDVSYHTEIVAKEIGLKG